jgi:hypothetical protein
MKLGISTSQLESKIGEPDKKEEYEDSVRYQYFVNNNTYLADQFGLVSYLAEYRFKENSLSELVYSYGYPEIEE